MKKYFDKFFGFTLSELLLALGIIGVIAAITIPSVSGNIQKRLLSSQIRSFVADVQHLMDRQLATKNARTLEDTDFANLDSLFSDNNFPVVYTCENGAECWTQTYKRLSDMADITESRILGENIDTNGRTVKLKNGAIVTFQHRTVSNNTTVDPTDKYYGMFRVDVNGDEGPNIVGRDVFWFLITKKGKIYDYYTTTNTTKPSDAVILSKCTDATTISNCLSVLMKNNWNMDY